MKAYVKQVDPVTKIKQLLVGHVFDRSKQLLRKSAAGIHQVRTERRIAHIKLHTANHRQANAYIVLSLHSRIEHGVLRQGSETIHDIGLLRLSQNGHKEECQKGNDLFHFNFLLG